MYWIKLNMSIFIALILGIIQGLTEFLPISSSGHLVLLQNIFNIENNAILNVKTQNINPNM